MSKKKKTQFICQQCGFIASQWVGKCSECGQWNSLVEEASESKSSGTKNISISSSTPQTIDEIDSSSYLRLITGISEFDRVVGGGLVAGSLTLIGGEPGIGKSTLLTTVFGKLAKLYPEKVALYVSGEESSVQIADRAKRLGINSSNLFIYNESNWENIKSQLKIKKPSFLVIDSIQTTVSSELTSSAGSVSQVREVTYEIMNYVKAMGITCLVIGHITKDGALAGPKILEHMVDSVVYFEGDQLGQYRLLRAIKNRFGNTNEVGIFEMKESGLEEVPNPSQYFLDDTHSENHGRSLSCILEGTRNLFVEIQALVVDNNSGNGRRTTQGIDSNRVSMIVAVIEKYFGYVLNSCDIYLNVVGGLKLESRDTDLSILASILSSYKSRSLPSHTIFLGEVGLSGEVRSIPKIEGRLKEIAQLNYRTVVTSEKISREYSGKFELEFISLRQAKDLENIFNV